VQEAAWIDFDILQQWIENVYAKLMNREPSILILDKFCSYLGDEFQDILKKYFSTEILYIDSGIISMVQPLDIGIIHSFKLRVKCNYYKWKVDHLEDKITIPLLISWIDNAWSSVPSSLIQDCYKKIKVNDDSKATCDGFVKEAMDRHPQLQLHSSIYRKGKADEQEEDDSKDMECSTIPEENEYRDMDSSVNQDEVEKKEIADFCTSFENGEIKEQLFSEI